MSGCVLHLLGTPVARLRFFLEKSSSAKSMRCRVNISLVSDGGGVHTTGSMRCPIKAALTERPKFAKFGCLYWPSNFIPSNVSG